MDFFSEERLKDVYPQLASRVRQMYDTLKAEGTIIRVTQGLRTWAEQDALYSQGRTTAGNIVTKAKGGQSYHNFGLAVDLVPMNLDGTADWNEQHPVWRRMVELGTGLGLTAGANWKSFKDLPHFQLTGVLPDSPDDVTRHMLQASGIKAVWAAIGGSNEITA